MSGTENTTGRGKVASTFIVNETTILNEKEFISENYILRKLNFETKLSILEWAARRRLIKNSNLCSCNTQMSFISKGRSIDEHTWRCKICAKELSVRSDSFCSRSHLSIEQILVIIYLWANGYPQNCVAHEAELGPGTTHTLNDWFTFCREICRKDLTDFPLMIGGLDEETLESKVVEIDQSNYFQQKFPEGNPKDDNWVLGGIERGSGKCFLVEIPDRSAETIESVIKAYVLPGSIIISDGRPSYKGIGKICEGIYEHQVVGHEERFINPLKPSLHTQNVKNMWMRTKSKIKKQFFSCESLYTSYIYEFVWRSKFRGQNLFTNFLNCVAQQYPFPA